MGKKKVETFVMPLTAEQQAYLEKLETLKQRAEHATAVYKKARKQCMHSITYQIDRRWGDNEGECWCNVCDKHFGHYCPKSPDHACHYYTEDDGLHVLLNNGELIQKPILPVNPEWDIITVVGDCKEDETDDACLFCGAPEERK